VARLRAAPAQAAIFFPSPAMPRKPQKGYYVKGRFVAEGSELDLQLKAELKGTTEASRTDRKRESDELQDLGKELLTLRADLRARLALPDKLQDALAEAQRITDFEGKRRQMQFVGKLMRKLGDEAVAAVRAALDEQKNGSAAEKLALHQAEHWRNRLIADDGALQPWLAEYPATDVQQLRALIRQARKDAPTAHQATVAEAQGQAPRKSRAYRELFQLVRAQMHSDAEGAEEPQP